MAVGTGLAKRIVVEGAGWVLVIAGIAAIALPGPGLLLLFGGLAILSQQYDWAARRVEPVQRKALQTAADSVQSWPRIVASALFALGLIAVGVFWGLRPPAPGWWPLRESFWLIGGWGTGATLIFSGVVALAMLGYSFVKFRGARDPHAEAASVASADH
ncbi:MAG: hypothetical protein AVDCRST_MAG36-313 [uncultured Nocardioidaceae bacterium]|uniref:Transmembrane protein (PGPGW) n=1 Tax=uncultured Nocardioidaceae bacterium TaxID=253824 RepID=A0A6J4KYW3_9ACTN|nr:MAG: hypothetical protein AVDCRST_MAG36-313 [uncultured Nocardioidaceae bacterium]